MSAVVARARMVVCGDTGVAHLASAYGTPSVLLFGPVWWVWMGGTYYNSRFESGDISYRLLTFLQLDPAADVRVLA